MKILLVNPNTYRVPPVPPIGIEHVAGAVEEAGHEAEIVDLCFSDSPLGDIDAAVAAFGPDIAGVSVRNIDTVLFQTNEFFLDGIRDIVRHLRERHNLCVIVGGAGVAVDPGGVVEYLGADYGVAGPAEGAINELLDDIARKGVAKRVRYRSYRYDLRCPRKTEKTDYARYLREGGIGGFDTHKGCSSSCVYCIEANTRVSFKPVDDVLAELRSLADRGCSSFHLCDSEFNEDLDHAIEFCGALKRRGPSIDWALYMKPANYNRKLFRAMKDSGVSLITLTVDSWKKCPLYWSDVEKIVFSAKSCGLKIMVDFLCGFPYEDEETLCFYLDLFRRTQPDGVGINTYIRLYRGLPITDIIFRDEALKKNLIGYRGDGGLVMPVFYNQLSSERLSELIAGESIFRIEGLEKGVNYSRRAVPGSAGKTGLPECSAESAGHGEER
ncbi:MAG: cobalamin-dependent protein [Nitrospiraceae bacterium]|nr:cobalamin-dependent protein [Nitrospiraceae bacterium]